MPIISRGALVDTKSTVIWQGDTAHYYGSWTPQSHLSWAGYAQLYRKQVWVTIVVNKRAGMVARLPLPVYERSERGRVRVPDHPFARLLARPNARQDPFTFWTWTCSTWDVYGEAMWAKVRDAGGRPVELLPLHPTAMTLEDDGTWTYRSSSLEVSRIPATDVVHFSTYNPDSMTRGMSRLEPLRATLENEDAARRATSSFWAKGARPGFALSHPKSLSGPAQERLRLQWDQVYAGVENTGKTLILEEGMTASPLTINNVDAQYVETRKLNREEVVAAYDMPPPAVHILDHATFSNITEQFRSVYRDTMAPVLNYFEAVLETQLRASVRPGASEPDFGDEVYAEFLLDEVLRGSFEARMEAYSKSHHMMLSEVRERENLPFVEGTDRIFMNAALVPMPPPPSSEGEQPPPPYQTVGLPALVEAGILTEQDARELLQIPGTAPGRPLEPLDVRSVLGRLGRVASVRDMNVRSLVAGLPNPLPVLKSLDAAVAAGDDVPTLRERISALATEEAS